MPICSCPALTSLIWVTGIMALSDTPVKRTTQQIFFSVPGHISSSSVSWSMRPVVLSSSTEMAQLCSCSARSQSIEVKLSAVHFGRHIGKALQTPPDLFCHTLTPWSYPLLCAGCHLYQLLRVSSDLIILVMQQITTWMIGRGQRRVWSAPCTLGVMQAPLLPHRPSAYFRSHPSLVHTNPVVCQTSFQYIRNIKY